MIKLNKILEAKYSYGQKLYHYTSILSAIKILDSNKLFSDRLTFDSDDEYRFSFSRTKDWLYAGIVKKFDVKLECAIEIDANKLSNNYKIKPYDYFHDRVFRYGFDVDEFDENGYVSSMKHTYHEFEDSIVLSSRDTIPNFNKYITKIYISRKNTPHIQHNDNILRQISKEVKLSVDDNTNSNVLVQIKKLIESTFHIYVEIV